MVYIPIEMIHLDSRAPVGATPPRRWIAGLLGLWLAVSPSWAVASQSPEPTKPVDEANQKLPSRVVELYRSADRELQAKNYPQAVTLAEKVLEMMPPDRGERGTVVETLFRAYLGLYEQDHNPRDLCRVNELLVEHERIVHQAYGDDSDNVTRILEAIHNHRTTVEALLQHDNVVCPNKVTAVPEPPAVEPLRPKPVERMVVKSTPVEHGEDRPNRPAVITGGTFVGLGGLLLIGTAVSAGVYTSNNAVLRHYLDLGETLDRPLTAGEMEKVDTAHRRNSVLNDMMIGMGISGAVMMVVGVPVLAVGMHRRRVKKVSFRPEVSPTHAGLSLSGRF